MDIGNILVIVGAVFILATALLTILTFASSVKARGMRPWLLTFIIGVILIIIGLAISAR